MALLSQSGFIILALIARVGLWLYWQLRGGAKLKLSVPSSFTLLSKSRWLPRLVFFLQVTQLAGFIAWPIPWSESRQYYFFLIGQVMFWVSLIFLVWSREVLGRAWAHATDFKANTSNLLLQRGPYRFIRHPIYLGFWIMFMAVEFIMHSWLLFLAVPLAWVFDRQARREEILLCQRHPEAYVAYQRHTWRFIPGIY